MAGLSDFAAQNALNYFTGQKSMPAVPSVFCALFTTAPTSDSGAGAVEVSGGNYSRVQVAGGVATNGATVAGNATLNFAAVPSWIVVGMSVQDITVAGTGAIPLGTRVTGTTGTTVTMNNNAVAAGVGSGDTIAFSAFSPATPSVGNEPTTVPGATLNGSATITFPQASLSWGTVTSWGLYDLASGTGAHLLAWDYLGNFAWLPFSGSNASPSVLTSPAHGYSNGDPVVVTAKFGGTLPATGGSWAGVLTVASSTTDTFTAGVNTTGTGDGLVRKIVQQSIPANVTASFAVSAFTVTLA